MNSRAFGHVAFHMLRKPEIVRVRRVHTQTLVSVTLCGGQEAGHDDNSTSESSHHHTSSLFVNFGLTLIFYGNVTGRKSSETCPGLQLRSHVERPPGKCRENVLTSVQGFKRYHNVS
ncbi:hypothetical protein F2P81_011235 [Scophthalmus maximus]|uniref:Uncharacterized protein n=1 Tax=Scophthalmus maximus TaxID=52904 RepID=A0A6A4SPM5_SCOMX|nr:hypothetical protein F2P81_011235 [Scophthalmus maximus]